MPKMFLMSISLCRANAESNAGAELLARRVKFCSRAARPGARSEKIYPGSELKARCLTFSDSLNDVGKIAFDAAEEKSAADEGEDRHSDRDPKHGWS